MNVSDSFLSLAVTSFYSLSRRATQQVAAPDSLRIFLIGARIISESCQVLESCTQIKMFICLLKHPPFQWVEEWRKDSRLTYFKSFSQVHC